MARHEARTAEIIIYTSDDKIDQQLKDDYFEVSRKAHHVRGSKKTGAELYGSSLGALMLAARHREICLEQAYARPELLKELDDKARAEADVLILCEPPEETDDS